MFGFWIVCTLLILVALIIILPSLLAEKPRPDLDPRKVSRALYDHKLGELERDLDNDLIDEEQYEAAKGDLQRTLIDDVAGRQSRVLKKSNKILPAMIALAIPVVAVFTYLKLDNGLPSLSPEFQARQTGQMPSMEEAVATLEERLKRDPKNLDGWLMLGRSYFMLEKFDVAADAYAKAKEITQGADADVLVDYGEARGFAMGQKFDATALQLFTRALRIDPDHQKGLWYAGLAAFQLEDYADAAGYWEKLIQRLPPDQQQAISALQAYLEEAREKAGTETAGASMTEDETTRQRAESAIAAVTVNVSLAEELQDQVGAADTLFIYARARPGPKMPVALVRMTASDLPATVTLDDTVAMIPAMNLSSVEQLEVIARISKSGRAAMQSGDLYGSIYPVFTDGTTTVDVTINSVAE